MRSNQHVFVVSRLLILLVAFNQYTKTTAYQSTGPSGRSVSSNFNQNHIDQPVLKSLKRPLLVVVDPKTKSRIHLVGVSHGSASSAELVKDVFSEIPNAAAVVLELCEDRFWSISLDAKIRPRGNETLAGAFDAKLIVIANHESKKVAAKTNTGIVAVFNEISSALRFAGQQGPIGGTFVLLGLFISNMQRMTRSSTGGDEFVTAMLEAERLDIPVRLGDAPQTDTLNSIKNVMSAEVFDPLKVVQGASLLAFSALGLLPVKSNSALSDRIPAHIMKASEWVNIPRAYLDNSSMLKSLLPLLYLSTAAFLLEIIDVGVDPDASSTAVAMSAATSVAAVQTTAPVLMSYMAGLLHTTELPALDTSLVLSIMTSFGAFLTGDLPPEVAMVIDAISVLLLIRMAKIIGTDRDCIIAEKIQTVAAEFPGQDVVVVIGMLHCNGVARWLLSGADPLNFNPALTPASE